jgi:hypothetical protein
MGFCSNLSRSCDTFRISLYADDVVLFLKQSQNYHWNCECFCTSFWPNNENEKKLSATQYNVLALTSVSLMKSIC